MMRTWSKRARMTAFGAVGGAAIFLAAPAYAADSCSGTAAFTFSSQWTSVFDSTDTWQFPSTSTCLNHSNGLGSRKLDGKLYQSGGQLYFGLDGGPGTRSELASKGLTNRNGSVTGTVYMRIATGGRKFTVSQLLNATPSNQGGGQDPIVRLEVNNGALSIIYYDNNGSASKRVSNVLTGLNDGSSFSFSIEQFAGSNNNQFDIEVKINGSTKLSRHTVTGYDSNRGYVKAGCYVNTDGGNGCRSSFSALSFNL